MALMTLLCRKKMSLVAWIASVWLMIGCWGGVLKIYRSGAVGTGGLANMQYSAVSCPPAVRATAATALLGGLGHRLPSAPLSAARLTDREGRERSNLYCGTVAKQQRRQKKQKNIWWLYNYTVNTVPPPTSIFPFFLYSFLFFPPVSFFFSGRVSAN